jgi:DNA-binding transcriptional LysR family regulator
MSATAAPDVIGSNRTSLQTRVEAGRRRAARAGRAPAQSDADPQTRWQSIEVRHLAALAAVASEGSFRRAAERLGYVQSAISGQISHLEHAVGARLLDRASGTPVVELTRAGEVLLRHTEEILARFETAYADVSSLGTRPAGAVRVAGLEQLAPRQVAEILSRFRCRQPFVRVQLVEIPPRTAGPDQLREGTLDMLIYEPPAVQSPLAQAILTRGDYVLLAPPGSDLTARSEPLRADELAALRPIVPASCAASEPLAAQLAQLGIDPDPVLAPESVATAQALVANGMGTAVVPARLVTSFATGVSAIDLSHLLSPQTIMIAFAAQESRSAAVDGFAQVIRETCGDEESSARLQDDAAVRERTPRRRAA